jgi:SAM-dependent methyltransferase
MTDSSGMGLNRAAGLERTTSLTSAEYWEAVYAGNGTAPREKEWSTVGVVKRVKGLVTKLLGKTLLAYTASYSDHLLWNTIYAKHMPRSDGASLLEIGSAPGEYLIRLSQTYGFVPYGMDTSRNGIRLNKALFESYGISPEHAIHADLVTGDFHEKYKSCFDIVISRGFIEHFTDLEEIIDRHVSVLKEGGRLIVSIPNFRGINYYLLWLFHRELIPLHNLNIMNKDAFARLFKRRELVPIYCDYYGTVSLQLVDVKGSRFPRLLHLAHMFQVVLNVACRLLLRDRGAECRWLSPYLLYIGRKRTPDQNNPHVSKLGDESTHI